MIKCEGGRTHLFFLPFEQIICNEVIFQRLLLVLIL